MSETDKTASQPARRTLLLGGGLLVGVIVLFALGKLGIMPSEKALNTWMETVAGSPWGLPAIILVFCVAAFLGVPQFALIAAAVADLGGLSVLVNNAGVGGPLAFVEQDTIENWQRQYEINLRSIMLGAKHAMPHLRASAPASIINISSIAGLAAAPGMGAYNATKAAVWMYTKTLALEAAKADWNVRCNSVHPVFIKTPILDPFIAMAGGDEDKAHERLARGIPLKRIGEPDDVAYCVLYLASDESKFVTGSEFKIDGGMTAQ